MRICERSGVRCPVKSDYVARRLCDLHYPICNMCMNHYRNLMEKDEEVKRLEAAAAADAGNGA